MESPTSMAALNLIQFLGRILLSIDNAFGLVIIVYDNDKQGMTTSMASHFHSLDLEVSWLFINLNATEQNAPAGE